MSRPTTSYAQHHVNETARAAREAHARQMRGETDLYVYYQTLKIRAFAEGEDTTGWTLAWTERLPSNLTVDQMVQYFAERTGRLPYLPGD